MKVGDLIKFKYDGYHKSYGIGVVTEIEYDLGDDSQSGAGYAIFKSERLMFRFSEMELISESRRSGKR